MGDVQRRLREFWKGLDEAVTPVELDEVLRERIGDGPVRPVVTRWPYRPRKQAWAIAAIGIVAAVALAGTALMLLDSDEAPPVRQEGATVTTATTLPSSTTAPPHTWNPILVTRRAKTPPPAATCPASANPQAPGPPDQARPDSDVWSNQAAAFDLHTGRVVHLDATGATWTFDVCTNTWQRLDPTVDPAESGPLYTALDDGSELVYDVDSDRTVSIGGEAVGVYDAGANTWTLRIKPAAYRGSWQSGAVYDPISGLIIIQLQGSGLAAYDVDTDTWTDVGHLRCGLRMEYDPATDLWSPSEPEPCYPVLAGYVADRDRLVFLGHGQTVDPRTGDSFPLNPPPGGAGGAWGRFSYAVGTDTAYTFGEQVCRLVPGTLGWACSNLPLGRGIDHYDGFSARVADPINDRLVLIDGHCCGGFSDDTEPQHHADVWAIDYRTGAWTELLAPAGE